MTEALISQWSSLVRRAAADTPLIDPLAVLEHGPRLRVVDLRPEAETGNAGFIPGSVFVSEADLPAAIAGASRTPIVLVDADGVRAASVASSLASSGAMVAAIDGGLLAWRRAGLGVTHDRGDASSTLRPIDGIDAPARGGHLTIDEVREHVRGPGAVRWIQVASLAFGAHASCVDGRDGRAVVGTPGGDAGELALALAALEQVTGRALTEAEIAAHLRRRVETFNDFYLHSDTETLEALSSALREDERTRDAVADLATPASWQAFLAAPPTAAREALLEHVTNPDHVGCGHLRLQLRHPDDYGVRAELVAGVIRSYYRLLWTGLGELRHVVLHGGHSEAAVLDIQIPEEIWMLSNVPVVSPRFRGAQAFVNHGGVAAFLRRTAVEHMRRKHDLTDEQAVQMGDALAVLAGVQLSETLGHLAKGLPIYEVVFSSDGTVDVRDASPTSRSHPS